MIYSQKFLNQMEIFFSYLSNANYKYSNYSMIDKYNTLKQILMIRMKRI